MAMTGNLTENRPMGASSHFTSAIMLGASATIPKIAYRRFPTTMSGRRFPAFAIHWSRYANCDFDSTTTGFSMRETVEISRFYHLLPVTLSAKLGRHLIGRLPNAHYRADWTMSCYSVPRAERHAVIDSRGARLIPRHLGISRDAADSDIGAQVLRPGDRGVLNWHPFEIRAKLDPHFPLSPICGEE